MRKLPPLDTLKAMRAAGMTLQAIGDKYGVTHQAVHYALKRGGCTSKRGHYLQKLYPPQHVLDHWRGCGMVPGQMARLCYAFSYNTVEGME